MSILLRVAAGATLLCAALTAHSQYDDLLSADGLDFDSSNIEEKTAHWTDGLKVTVDHSHTRVPHHTHREQSSFRLEYENNIADGLFLRLDVRHRHFWSRDDLAENRGGAYGHTKWQRVWLQYSRGACTAKAGRQVLIWGEVEGAFATDMVTPFDYTEQLLTDYGNVRLAQDMLLTECFVSGSQFQLFVTPEAETDVFQHHRVRYSPDPRLPPIDLAVDTGEEWGGRYKWSGSGLDVSVMYARLFDNTPTIQAEYRPTTGDPVSASAFPPLLAAGLLTNDDELPPGFTIGAALARFDFFGVSLSKAIGGLLLEAELGYRDKQLVPLSYEHTERLDAVLGFEYTTTSNHILNGGIWRTHFSNDALAEQDVDIVTLGWRKSFRNDNLVMSLLSNWASSPQFASATLLSEYQWNDYLSSAFALGWADLGELAGATPLINAKRSLTLSVKIEF